MLVAASKHKQHDEHNNLNHHDVDKHREYEDNDGFKHITVIKTWFNGNFTSTHSFITYFSRSIFIGMYLNNDHKENNNTEDNKTEQTENKDNAKDKATNEKDQSNEKVATKEDKSSESDNSTKKIIMSQMK